MQLILLGFLCLLAIRGEPKNDVRFFISMSTRKKRFWAEDTGARPFDVKGGFWTQTFGCRFEKFLLCTRRKITPRTDGEEFTRNPFPTTSALRSLKSRTPDVRAVIRRVTTFDIKTLNHRPRLYRKSLRL